MDSDLTEIPIGDLSFLRHLVEVSSIDHAKNLISKAPASIEKEITAIKQAIAGQDTAQLKDACHALRGACYSIQVRRLAEIVGQMEARSSSISEAEKLLLPLEEVYRETIAWWLEISDKDLI